MLSLPTPNSLNENNYFRQYKIWICNNIIINKNTLEFM
jgi:hypothetical protein